MAPNPHRIRVNVVCVRSVNIQAVYDKKLDLWADEIKRLETNIKSKRDKILLDKNQGTSLLWCCVFACVLAVCGVRVL